MYFIRYTVAFMCIYSELCTVKKNYVALAHKETIPTERPPLVGEFSANFFG
jgi:hypothetical protein